MKKYKSLFLQIIRFGIVGLSAATIHFLVVVLLVQTRNTPPLIANIAGFISGFQMSFWGNRLWTFQQSSVSNKSAFMKLLLVQIINFIANESLFYIFLCLHVPYQLALFLVLSLLAVGTFIINKTWVFK